MCALVGIGALSSRLRTWRLGLVGWGFRVGGVRLRENRIYICMYMYNNDRERESLVGFGREGEPCAR